MCGICGKVSLNSDNGLNKDLILKMCSVLKHRGPDDEGVYLNRVKGEGCRVKGAGKT